MSMDIEEALKLPKEEKVKLYYALQEDLECNDTILAEDQLTPEQWKELGKRIKDTEAENTELISIEAFKRKLDEKIDDVRGNFGSRVLEDLTEAFHYYNNILKLSAQILSRVFFML